MKKKFILIFIFLGFISSTLVAQRQELSRQDSAMVREYEKEIKMNIDAGKQMQATKAINHIAQIYWHHSQNNKAIDYFTESLVINKKLNNEHAIGQLHNNLAMIYNDMGNYSESLAHFQKALAYIKSRNNYTRTVEAYLNVAAVQKKLKKYPDAVQSLDIALQLAKTKNLEEQVVLCYGELSELHTQMGNKKEAEFYYQLYADFQKSIYRKSKDVSEKERLRREKAEIEKQLKELELVKKKEELSKTREEMQYISGRHKLLADSLSKQEAVMALIEQEKKNQELENKQLIREKQIQHSFIVIAIIALLILIGFLVYMWYAQKRIKRANNMLSFKNTEINQKNEEIITQAESIRQAKELTDQKHKQITASIEYARLIQKAMMNPRKKLLDFLPNSFIWYAPRDVVSGDFFWYTKIGKKLIIAAGDCTGHGVPGGFLSMTGHNLLTQIIQHRKVTDPAQILRDLEDEFSLALHQEFSENMDGIDISVCMLDEENKKLHFSGAKSPFVIIENNEIKILEPDSYSIGGISLMKFAKQTQKEFNTQTIDMPKDFSFYMHSDGPVDQFNKVDKKRLMKKRFYDILLTTDNQKVSEQKKEIIQRFNDWRGSTKQTDDILLIGGRVKDYKIF